MTSRQMLSKSLTWGNWLQMSLSYLPGTASLLEELDKKLMVLLRDGRTLIGEQLNTPNGLFLLLFKVEVSFLNKMWIWNIGNRLDKNVFCQVTSVLLTSSPIWCFTRQSRGSTWASAMVTFLVVFSLWEARMSCCSGKLTQRKQSQKILVSPRSAWRRFWRNRWTEQLYRLFWSFAYFPPCQAVQQAEKEEADRIRVKAFKERGLTYTAQGDCEDMY